MKLLLNTDRYKENLKNDRVCVIDGGARGELFPPFDKLSPDILFIVKFDPDEDAKISSEENGLIMNKALWKEECEMDLHVANRPSVSSIYPPDFDVINKLWANDPKMLRARETNKIVKVPCTSLDELRKNNEIPPIDFIKLDIHSAEYECMIGAKESLTSSVVGVLAETWSLPVHRGQKLHSDFETLMNSNDLFIFNLLKTGASTRNIKNSNFSRHQPFKFDSLFFRDILIRKESFNSSQNPLKHIGLADLFGFVGYALQLNEYFKEQDIIDNDLFKFNEKFLMSKDSFQTKFFQKIIDKLSIKVSGY